MKTTNKNIAILGTAVLIVTAFVTGASPLARAELSAPDTIKILNNLIHTAKDAQDGYKTAAEGVAAADLKTLFSKKSQERMEFVTDLQNKVIQLGGVPEDEGTAKAAVYRGFMKVKAAVTQGDAHAVVSETRQGEGAAVNAYEDALKTDLPGNVKPLIEDQSKKVHDSLEELKRLEAITKKS